MKQVVILGGGIAGVEAAILGRKKGWDVELISDRDFLFIYPISIWIPVGKIRENQAKISLNQLARIHGFKFTLDKLISIQAEKKVIQLEKQGDYPVDNLIVAIGSSKVKHNGLETTYPICGSPEQLLQTQEQFLQILSKGQGSIACGFGGNPLDPSSVRGGPAFEVFFNIHHILKQKNIRRNFELTFFAPMAEPGSRMGTKALQMFDQIFKKNSFQTRFGKKISKFEKGKVLFEDGSELNSDLIIFIPAGAGHEVVLRSDLPQTLGGHIKIEPNCQIQGKPGWYAIGDVAAIEGPDWRAKQGHLAEVMGRIAIQHLITGESKNYMEHINILCLMDMGNGAGLVYRDSARALFIPLPIVGHWLKVLWGYYYKFKKKVYLR